MVDFSNNRVLVVGGNGFIGSHIVRHLLESKAEVAVMDVTPPKVDFEQVDWFTGNLTDNSFFASAAYGCNTVVFLANSSLPGSSNQDLSSEVESHVKTSIKAAESCCALGVNRFVFASSGGTVYGYDSDQPLSEDSPTKPLNAYGVSKLAIENYLRVLGVQRGMETVSLRVSNPYGEGQLAQRSQGFIAAAFQHAMAGREMPIWGDGKVERDFLHVSDVAKAFVQACSKTTLPETINIGSGQARSLIHILDEIEKLLGKEIPVKFEPGRVVDVKKNVLDINLAKTDLEWEPQVGLRKGLERTANWWLSNHSK